jgi:antitoxin ChpS
MHLAKLRTVGGSVMFAIPKAIMEGLGLTPNTQVGLSVSDGRLIVEPHPRQRYTLSDLIDQCDPSAPMTEADQAWLEVAPVGREAI